MGKAIDQLRAEVAVKESYYRRLKRLMESESFIEYIEAYPERDEEITTMIRMEGIEAFKDMLRHSEDITQLSIDSLRKLAAKYKVRNYSRLDREQLIQRIQRIAREKANDD